MCLVSDQRLRTGSSSVAWWPSARADPGPVPLHDPDVNFMGTRPSCAV